MRKIGCFCPACSTTFHEDIEENLPPHPDMRFAPITIDEIINVDHRSTPYTGKEQM